LLRSDWWEQIVYSAAMNCLCAKYGEDTLRHAMQMVASGNLSKRQAMLQFGILLSTVAKRLKNAEARPDNLGRFKRVFNDEFEKELVNYTTEMQNRFMA